MCGGINMDKVYKTANGRKTYCNKHFSQKHRREPGIMDIASIGICDICNPLPVSVDVFIVGSHITEIECQHYIPYSKKDRQCKNSKSHCEHIPQNLYEIFKDKLEIQQAHGFLCYKQK